jgi:hypothetical protein
MSARSVAAGHGWKLSDSISADSFHAARELSPTALHEPPQPSRCTVSDHSRRASWEILSSHLHTVITITGQSSCRTAICTRCRLWLNGPHLPTLYCTYSRLWLQGNRFLSSSLDPASSSAGRSPTLPRNQKHRGTVSPRRGGGMLLQPTLQRRGST